jgi:hypothetical protein
VNQIELPERPAFPVGRSKRGEFFGKTGCANDFSGQGRFIDKQKIVD